MNVLNNDKTDLLYIRLDENKQSVINKRIDKSITLDVGKKGKIIGIEILNASENVNLNGILPVSYKVRKVA
jgi:uncharacterized protein YuzE